MSSSNIAFLTEFMIQFHDPFVKKTFTLVKRLITKCYRDDETLSIKGLICVTLTDRNSSEVLYRPTRALEMMSLILNCSI
jgi:hypothetical protein